MMNVNGCSLYIESWEGIKNKVRIPILVITFIGTLAYTVRIVGVTTGRISVSFALFNILVLVSRTASTIQSPILIKYVETSQGE